ncbi:MAG: lipid II flippase MurJ, partial [Pseudomonadota bacterium]
LPQLSKAQAGGDGAQFSALLDWGLRLVLLLALPCAVALLVFAQPLVAVLYHYGRFTPHDVQQTVLALTGYGVGLMGLVGVKILAPGFYASQDIRTPVKIGIAVLVITQLLNLVTVPSLGHAGLALSIGLGSLVNATWLFIGLRRAGRYTPSAGWALFALRVVGATTLLGVGLWLAAHHIDWIGMRAQPLMRVGAMAGCLALAGVVYFGALMASGLNLRQAIKR